MARSFASASSQYCAGTLSRALPITMACWYYPTQSTTSQILMSHSTAGGTARLALGWMAATNTVSASTVDSSGVSTSATIATTPASLANNWNFLCGVFASTTSRVVHDGITSGSDTNSRSAGTPNTVVIAGRIASGAYGGFFDGRVAQAAVWNVALSAGEVANLYNSGIGLDPRSVRPDALVAYWPLLNNDGDQDYWGNFHLTASGSPTYAQHPPVLMRSRPKYVVLGSAAPSIATIEIAGTRQVGNTLTCNATSSPSGGTFTYQWYMADDIDGLNGTPISGATSQTYELSYANIGAATKLYEGLDSAGEAFIACGATPTVAAVEGDETVSSYVSITEASVTASATSPFESLFIR